jgi:large subunit ribosomal protein L5
MTTNLKAQFETEIAPKVAEKLNIKNVRAIPRIEKINVNVGMGKILQGKKDYEQFEENITLITGQKPVVRNSRKAISNFKLRIGMPVGLSVSLRGTAMYNFLYKLIHITAPRIRDFRGFPRKSFDGSGNYSLGITEHTVFPEINPDDIVRVHGLEITIVTSAKNDDEGRALLEAFGFPFKKQIEQDRSEA